MARTVQVRDVKALRSKSGNVRFVLVDEQGNEYTTFREEIGRQAAQAQGRTARIEFHESERNGYTNVYLDRVEVLDEAADPDEEHVEEVAWKTAIDAAPWLVGTDAPTKETPADELFDRLKPFKELVAEDIRDGEPD
jgi:phage terminase large subunit GpA-like protein